MMDETIRGEVSARFEEVTGNLKRSHANKLRDLQDITRYLLFAVMQENWSFWCGLGYKLQPGVVPDYPAAAVILEVSPTAPHRREIIRAMQEVAKERGWYSWNLSESRMWSGITRERSLRDFLSSPDHVAEIKKFFMESLDELQEIKEQYPHLPWDGSAR